MSTHDETAGQAAQEAFIAELRHWREVAGFSQKRLAAVVGYTASYVSKVEHGAVVPSRPFVEKADECLSAGRVLLRRWADMSASPEHSVSGKSHAREAPANDPQLISGPDLLVEHEHAELTYVDEMFQTLVRRELTNLGSQPVTQYLIRITADRYPGDPERSNRLYREDPITWEEIGLSAKCGDEPMTWRVKHDRDAFKELWLLFENPDGKFPLYPGETTWIEYVYTVSAHKWGPWWQRAVRLPTRRMSLLLSFPIDLQPAVWGIETSMTAEASPFRDPLVRTVDDDRVTFNWAVEDPPLHTRYRIEWKFKGAENREDDTMKTMNPSERMRSLDIAQDGDPVLTEATVPFDLPAEAEDARRVISQLVGSLERVAQVHNFAKGMGLAAPQIHIGRAAAVIRTAEGESITLLNPRIIDESADTDEQYEGCLSFFDVRGKVPRPLMVEVEHQDTDGAVRITEFTNGTARLVSHEIDHLHGILYRSRMRPGVEPIPISQYKGTGQRWGYTS